MSFDAIDFADGSANPPRSAQSRDLNPCEVAQHLRGERLVHLDEIHVAKSETRALERDRRGEHRPHEQLLARIERRVRSTSG